jgi:hypothetical protein
VPQHHAEQPDLARYARLGGELYLELSKIHLRALPLASAAVILRRRWSGGHAPRTIANSAKLGKFHPALLRRLRPALTHRAQKLGITRQALIKMWIAERLER